MPNLLGCIEHVLALEVGAERLKDDGFGQG